MHGVDSNTFRLGITMAGAASAGCYTAGVMDYLFEILDLWERAKFETDYLPELQDRIPKHSVVIEAMGGASAGGMTCAMSAIYALDGNINPVKVPGVVNQRKNNVFYDSWVLMGDDCVDDNRVLLERILDLEDLKSGKIDSLLNSKFIDQIANRSFPEIKESIQIETGQSVIEGRVSQLPSYVSKDLQLLFSHCLLRGIPLEVNFESDIAKKGRKSLIPNHTTFEHYFMSHFHLNSGKLPSEDKYLWLNPYEKVYSDILKLSTKATGAFPIGLIHREFTPAQFSEKYIKTVLKRILSGRFGIEDPHVDNTIEFKYLPKNYSSLTVDGGAINNEPYREVLSILKDKYGDVSEKGYHRYGVVMIDPFPDRAQTQSVYSKPEDLLDIGGSMIAALVDQSRIKRLELIEADVYDYHRAILFPRKWKIGENGKPLGPEVDSIACSSCMAFGGFLDIRFREHDYFLGRNNARNFFRYFYSFPYIKDEKDPDKSFVHPIHANWTDAMIEAFKVVKNDKIFLPIVPDLNILFEKQKVGSDNQYKYDIPEMPVFDPTILFEMKPKFEKRILKMIELFKERGKSKVIEREALVGSDFKNNKESTRNEKKRYKEEAIANEVQGLMNQIYPKTILNTIGSFVGDSLFSLFFVLSRRSIAKLVTKKIIHEILKDLSAKALVKGLPK